MSQIRASDWGARGYANRSQTGQDVGSVEFVDTDVGRFDTFGGSHEDRRPRAGERGHVLWDGIRVLLMIVPPLLIATFLKGPKRTGPRPPEFDPGPRPGPLSGHTIPAVRPGPSQPDARMRSSGPRR